MAPNFCQQAALDICGRCILSAAICGASSDSVLLDEARVTSTLFVFFDAVPDDVGHVIVAFFVVGDEG